MTDHECEMLADKMPEVVRGTAVWSPTEAAHLAACPECEAEWQLLTAATRIGAEVEARFDADATARAVAERRRRAPAERWPARRYLVGLAAAAAFALIFRPAAAPTPTLLPGAAEVRFLPELDSLDVAELTLVADGIDAAPLTETTIVEGQPLFELDSTQLERVLRSLEG